MAPILSYASVSLSNVAATTCQYEALKHVTFAVQTLGKCAKMFPVMVWGYFILKKRYTLKDVMLAVLITSGCFIFFMTGPTASRVAHDKNSSMFGILLMMGYLSADGYTSTFQQKMFKGYQMTSYNQVLFVSLCSIALSSFGESPAAAELRGAVLPVGDPLLTMPWCSWQGRVALGVGQASPAGSAPCSAAVQRRHVGVSTVLLSCCTSLPLPHRPCELRSAAQNSGFLDKAPRGPGSNHAAVLCFELR